MAERNASMISTSGCAVAIMFVFEAVERRMQGVIIRHAAAQQRKQRLLL